MLVVCSTPAQLEELRAMLKGARVANGRARPAAPLRSRRRPAIVWPALRRSATGLPTPSVKGPWRQDLGLALHWSGRPAHRRRTLQALGAQPLTAVWRARAPRSWSPGSISAASDLAANIATPFRSTWRDPQGAGTACDPPGQSRCSMPHLRIALTRCSPAASRLPSPTSTFRPQTGAPASGG